MIQTADLMNDGESDDPPIYDYDDTDAVSHGLGSGAYVARHVEHSCVQTYPDSPLSRFPDTFDRFYFDTPTGPALVDVLADGTPEQLSEQRARKHVEFKMRWAAEQRRTYLALPESELAAEKIRRLVSGSPEPAVSVPASAREPRPKRGQVSRPKAGA